ncbi:hypothetical protein RN04_14460 [Arthrobacter sp. W1]|nr:hypothetical protein RN04_14460 [Arthrobacter sp. W1]
MATAAVAAFTGGRPATTVMAFFASSLVKLAIVFGAAGCFELAFFAFPAIPTAFYDSVIDLLNCLGIDSGTGCSDARPAAFNRATICPDRAGRRYWKSDG